ncbi:MAG: hypothetical protein ACP5EP_08215 [Acidobacteriaceae bacterium]
MMETFKASVQYGDWEGTAAADGAHPTSVEEYLGNKGLINPNEFLVAASLYVQEKSTYVRVFVFEHGKEFESVKDTLIATSGPILVREVEIELTLEEFVDLFKRFSVVLTWSGLQLEGRNYSVV